jgi:hypothetical protein
MSQERIVLQEDLTQELTLSKSNIRVWLLSFFRDM